MSGSRTEGADVVAWVESPFQLLGALEAHAAGLLGDSLAVLPRAGVDPLAVTLAELRGLGLPAGVDVRPAAAAPPRRVARLAVGDAFSGQVQRLLAVDPPRRVVLLDDGRATRRMLDALVSPAVPLLRPHVPAGRARALLARAAIVQLHRRARRGRLEVVTALDVPPGVREAADAAGVLIRTHDFAWVRGLPAAGDAAAPGAVVVLGTSLVANDLIAAEPYLEWVRSIARTAQGRRPLTYRAHRKEDERTLAPLAEAGVDVRLGDVPIEVSLRRIDTGQEVVTLPTTAASTLRMISPHARIREFAVPDGWWLPTVPNAARDRLVPDQSSGPATPWYRSSVTVPTPLGAL